MNVYDLILSLAYVGHEKKCWKELLYLSLCVLDLRCNDRGIGGPQCGNGRSWSSRTVATLEDLVLPRRPDVGFEKLIKELPNESIGPSGVSSFLRVSN